MPRTFLVILALVAVTAAYTPSPTPEVGKSLRDAANNFAIRLLQVLSTKQQGNLVVSPWSLTSALLMLHEGARGKTAAELRESLSLPENIQLTREGYARIIADITNNTSTNILDIANAMFPDKSFSILKEYVNIITTTYNGSVQTVDYRKREETARTINQWAEQNTRGLIKQVIAPDVLTPETVLVLANAVFFKGQWSFPFNPKRTTEEVFEDPDNQKRSTIVQMMSQAGKFQYADIPEIESQALVLPYNNSKFEMLLLLPYETSSVQKVISKITSVEDIQERLDEKFVLVSVPRFNITSELKLNEPLKQLGVQDIFTRNANLTGISKNVDLRVTDVLQKAVIEVNEEGTTAAGVNVIVTGTVSVQIPFIFNANRPFLSVIVEKATGVILFFSVVKAP